MTTLQAIRAQGSDRAFQDSAFGLAGPHFHRYACVVTDSDRAVLARGEGAVRSAHAEYRQSADREFGLPPRPKKGKAEWDAAWMRLADEAAQRAYAAAGLEALEAERYEARGELQARYEAYCAEMSRGADELGWDGN